MLSPNANPFAGGSFNPGTVPGVSGTIAPAGGGGSTLLSGVQGSEPRIARPDRGSNITVPYARVVSHSSGRTSLPAKGGAKNDDRVNPKYVETQNLFTGRLAFILGRRGKNYEGEYTKDTQGTDGQQVPFRAANAVSKFAIGGADINTMQRMCSFEYLERYFHHVLSAKSINFNNNLVFTESMALLPNSMRKQKFALKTSAPKITNIDAVDILTRMNNYNTPTPPEALKKNPQLSSNLERSGIFFHDSGPFLRGRTIEKSISEVGENKKRVGNDIGDQLAFQRLEELIAETGALDWQPDGIVNSKLSQGDAQLDDELDARDGMLFNLTIQGPQITSSWAGDLAKAVLPLDKVFVVLVGDVWYGGVPVGLEMKRGKDYDEAKETEFNKGNYTEEERNDIFYRDSPVEENLGTMTITNLRVQLATSSQMISYSEPKPGSVGHRMGLKSSKTVSEYIIGGWCIGTVMDNAAARSSREGVALLGAVKKQRITHAINVAVNVRWWSADRLYRSYMNVGGKVRTRYSGHVDKSQFRSGSLSASATQRGEFTGERDKAAVAKQAAIEAAIEAAKAAAAAAAKAKT